MATQRNGLTDTVYFRCRRCGWTHYKVTDLSCPQYPSCGNTTCQHSSVGLLLSNIWLDDHGKVVYPPLDTPFGDPRQLKAFIRDAYSRHRSNSPEQREQMSYRQRTPPRHPMGQFVDPSRDRSGQLAYPARRVPVDPPRGGHIQSALHADSSVYPGQHGYSPNLPLGGPTSSDANYYGSQNQYYTQPWRPRSPLPLPPPPADYYSSRDQYYTQPRHPRSPLLPHADYYSTRAEYYTQPWHPRSPPPPHADYHGTRDEYYTQPWYPRSPPPPHADYYSSRDEYYTQPRRPRSPLPPPPPSADYYSSQGQSHTQPPPPFGMQLGRLSPAGSNTSQNQTASNMHGDGVQSRTGNTSSRRSRGRRGGHSSTRSTPYQRPRGGKGGNSSEKGNPRGQDNPHGRGKPDSGRLTAENAPSPKASTDAAPPAKTKVSFVKPTYTEEQMGQYCLRCGQQFHLAASCPQVCPPERPWTWEQINVTAPVAPTTPRYDPVAPRNYRDLTLQICVVWWPMVRVLAFMRARNSFFSETRQKLTEVLSGINIDQSPILSTWDKFMCSINIFTLSIVHGVGGTTPALLKKSLRPVKPDDKSWKEFIIDVLTGNAGQLLCPAEVADNAFQSLKRIQVLHKNARMQWQSRLTLFLEEFEHYTAMTPQQRKVFVTAFTSLGSYQPKYVNQEHYLPVFEFIGADDIVQLKNLVSDWHSEDLMVEDMEPILQKSAGGSDPQSTITGAHGVTSTATVDTADPENNGARTHLLDEEYAYNYASLPREFKNLELGVTSIDEPVVD